MKLERTGGRLGNTIDAQHALKSNCPNCGAPITGNKCEYCGTVFYDFSKEIATLDETILRLKLQEQQAKIFSYVFEELGKNSMEFDKKHGKLFRTN